MNSKKLSGFLLFFSIVLVLGNIFGCSTEKAQIPDPKNVVVKMIFYKSGK